MRCIASCTIFCAPFYFMTVKLLELPLLVSDNHVIYDCHLMDFSLRSVSHSRTDVFVSSEFHQLVLLSWASSRILRSRCRPPERRPVKSIYIQASSTIRTPPTSAQGSAGLWRIARELHLYCGCCYRCVSCRFYSSVPLSRVP